MNKLKLLLYQKFINILFSIISQNLKQNFRFFIEQTKILKLKKFLKIELKGNNSNVYFFL